MNSVHPNPNKTLFLKFKSGSYKIDGSIGSEYNQPVPNEIALEIINNIEYINVPEKDADAVNDSLVALYDGIKTYGIFRFESTTLVGSYI